MTWRGAQVEGGHGGGGVDGWHSTAGKGSRKVPGHAPAINNAPTNMTTARSPADMAGRLLSTPLPPLRPEPPPPRRGVIAAPTPPASAQRPPAVSTNDMDRWFRQSFAPAGRLGPLSQLPPQAKPPQICLPIQRSHKSSKRQAQPKRRPLLYGPSACSAHDSQHPKILL